ncbi:MAG: hypothetical protein A2020_06000 [Lentisphaerae bacterium GWF2_45_14]|nr:MAG: hypothetical protein A2020_06000 [Lentisphaerae bacterium GWF2_45_14]
MNREEKREKSRLLGGSSVHLENELKLAKAFDLRGYARYGIWRYKSLRVNALEGNGGASCIKNETISVLEILDNQ